MLRRLPAVFMRGGTSKGLVLHEKDLPADQPARDEIFLAAMGSPDAYGRQLNGMGGGLSSLSKVCIVAPPSRPDADVDYTFAQVQVREPRVDYHSNCGNMSSAIGPFAVDEGLVRVADGHRTVRIHNTNTKKIIHAHFAVRDGKAVVEGNCMIPGVSGSGAPVRLDFLDPGGATTRALLPSGNPVDALHVPGHGVFEASMVDAANACVFVRASDVGIRGVELPEQLEHDRPLLERLAAIRVSASLAMGIGADAGAATKKAVPYIGVVAPGTNSVLLSGERLEAHCMDLSARMLSNGQPHRALPLTASLCLAVAAGIPGTIVHQCATGRGTSTMLRIATPSGVLEVDAELRHGALGWRAVKGSFLRTARRLFEGSLCY